MRDYPKNQEAIMRKKREGGKRSAEVRKQDSEENTLSNSPAKTLGNSPVNSLGGNEKKGKEKEGNRKDARKVNGKHCDHVTVFGPVDPRGCSDQPPTKS